MRLRLACSALILACLGCELPAALSGANATGKERAIRSRAKASPTPSVSPSEDAVSLPRKGMSVQSGILEAIQNTFAIGEVGRGQSTITLISNNGGTLISDKGLGIVSNNGGSIISNNGGGYRVLQADLPTDFAVPAVSNLLDPPQGLRGPSGEIAKFNRRGDPNYVYYTYFYKPSYGGDVLAVPRIVHDPLMDVATGTLSAAQLVATHTERYTWAAIGMKLLGGSFTPPFDARLTYPIQVVKSERVKITRAMNVYVDATITAMVPSPKMNFKGMTADFVMDVPLLAGGKEQLTMKADQFAYRPGQAPGESPFFNGPIKFGAKGGNDRGDLEMTVENLQDNGGDLVGRITGHHVLKADGRKATRTQLMYVDGRIEDTVVDVTSGVEAVFSYGADNSGAGVVRQLGSLTELGSIRWNAKGEATISFSDGTTSQVLIF